MDIILRIVIVTLLLVMVIGAIVQPKHWRWTVCFVAAALGTSAFVIGNSATDILTPNSLPGNTLLNFMAKTIVISVWLLVQCSFDDQFRFDRFRLGVTSAWIGGVFISFWQRGSPLGIVIIAFALLLMLHLIWTILRDWDGDMRQRRREARIWISAVMVGLLLIDLIIDLTMGFSWRPASFLYVQNCLILISVLILVATTVKIDVSTIASNTPIKDNRQPQLSKPAVQLAHLMASEQLYLRPDLRFADIVARLPISEASTRQLINDEFGQGHFRSFLNHYRIKHAQTLLLAPEHRSSKLIAIAFDSGFSSLASFQRAFRRETGLTASQWRLQKNI